ncbi:MAG: Xaa-Pro peptidase family protein [Hyphomicrobiaceae bacterium]
MQTHFAHFSRLVHEERIARARAAMAEARHEALIVIALEHLYYFGGYDSWVGANCPQAMILTRGNDAPTLLVRDVDLTLARETTFLSDIRTYRLNADDFPDMVREILAEKGVRSGSVGIEQATYALPMLLGDVLRQSLHPMTLADSTELLGRLRILKSPAELDLMEQAARYAEIGLEACRRFARPGITEIALSAEIEAAMRRAGSDYWSIPIELTSGFRTPGGHGTAREKVLEPGDLVHVEFAGVSHRYHATAIQTLAIGPPSRRARDVYALGIESLKAGISAIRIGAPVDAVEEASLAPLRREGLAHTAMMRFGYGIGIAYPPIWLEPLTIARGFSTRLEPGMTFVLHSCIELPDEGLGVIQGGTYVLEPTGMRMLAGAGDVDLLIAGG